MPPGFEPGHKGFADLGLTAWLWHRALEYYGLGAGFCQADIQIHFCLYIIYFSYKPKTAFCYIMFVVEKELKSTWKIYKWEILRLTSNWRRTAAVLLLPAAFMLIALNIFPFLINYMSTGNFGRNPVILVDPPASFRDYLEEIDGTTAYKFQIISAEEAEADYSGANFTKSLKAGTIWVYFEDGDLPFDEEIARYYENLAQGLAGAISHARINITYDDNSPITAPKAEAFEDLVIEGYKDTLLDRLGGNFREEGKDPFVVDDFNIVTKITDNRSVANSNAARVIPGIVMLLAYYCVYSLACDLFAAEKDRGFFNKLLLSPISPKSIVRGKVLTMMTVGGISSLVTIFLLFMSSWLNWSNDSMSLLPFGMFLTPLQVLQVLLVIIAAVYSMSSCTVFIVFSLSKLQDIMINLQLPLILFLMDFFLTLFRFNRPLTVEYTIPLHNNICLIRDIYASQAHLWQFIIVVGLDILCGALIFRINYKKVERL